MGTPESRTRMSGLRPSMNRKRPGQPYPLRKTSIGARLSTGLNTPLQVSPWTNCTMSRWPGRARVLLRPSHPTVVMISKGPASKRKWSAWQHPTTPCAIRLSARSRKDHLDESLARLLFENACNLSCDHGICNKQRCAQQTTTPASKALQSHDDIVIIDVSR